MWMYITLHDTSNTGEISISETSDYQYFYMMMMMMIMTVKYSTRDVLHAVWKDGRHRIPRHNRILNFLIEPRIILQISSTVKHHITE